MLNSAYRLQWFSSRIDMNDDDDVEQNKNKTKQNRYEYKT